MPVTVVLDEVHLTFRIPATLSAGEVRAVRRVLNSKAFTDALRRAVLAEMKKRAVTPTVRVAVAR
jgi:hypothetical protein